MSNKQPLDCWCSFNGLTLYDNAHFLGNFKRLFMAVDLSCSACIQIKTWPIRNQTGNRKNVQAEQTFARSQCTCQIDVLPQLVCNWQKSQKQRQEWG
jgi:hypothetical protein